MTDFAPFSESVDKIIYFNVVNFSNYYLRWPDNCNCHSTSTNNMNSKDEKVNALVTETPMEQVEAQESLLESDLQIDPKAESRFLRKMDRKLIPILSWMFFFSYLGTYFEFLLNF